MRNVSLGHKIDRESGVKIKLKMAFHNAKSNDEKLKAFTAMEPYFEDKHLVRELIKLAIQLKDFPEKALFFGKRALRILIQYETNNLPLFGQNSIFTLSDFETFCYNGTISYLPHNLASSLYISLVLLRLCSASLKLKRFDECLSYANWVNNRILTTLLLDNASLSPLIVEMLINTQLLLATVKAFTGRKDEVVVHYKNILEVKEKFVGEGCIELGEANRDVFEEYVSVGETREALPFCLKALEIYEKHLGRDSEEVVRIRKGLAFIYDDLGEYEKALEHNQLAQCAVKNVTPVCSDSLRVGNGELLIKLGRYEGAVNVLKGVVIDAATEEGRVSACASLAKAFVHMEEFADATKYLKTAGKILEKKKIDPFIAATSFNDMSNLYEMMNDCETALSLLRRALILPELPQKYLPKCSDRLFYLTISTGNEKEGIRYLEDLVEILKKKFGPIHSEVGYGYKHLGLACVNFGQDELAVNFLANAKDIMDVSLGPQHLESLMISQDLSVSCWNLRRYDIAIDNQKKVVDGFKGLGASEQEYLNEAVGMLNQMKKCIAESHAMVLPQSKDGEDPCETISKCGKLDDRD